MSSNPQPGQRYRNNFDQTLVVQSNDGIRVGYVYDDFPGRVLFRSVEWTRGWSQVIPLEFEEGGRYRNPIGRKLTILAVDDAVSPNGEVFEVLAYRYDDGHITHLRPSYRALSWERLPKEER